MIRKSLLLAVAAAATFGASMLMTSTAEARGFGPGAHGPNNSRASFARVIPPRVHPGHPHRHPHWHVHWRYPRIWVAPRTVYTAYATPVAAVANTCNCLTKTYTQDPNNSNVNIVVFKDVCTGELAMNPTVQAPIQQSEVAPQVK